MFRKLQDTISAAANAVMGNEDNTQAVQTLVSMGFSDVNARTALQQTNGDVDRAADVLLSGGGAGAGGGGGAVGGPPMQANSISSNSSNNHDAALDVALQESLQSEERRQLELARQASKSAAASRAGQAAVTRAVNPSPNSNNSNSSAKHKPLTSHPKVQVPTKLQDKTKEEQLLRCADRMKSYPRAVDTLYIVLTSIQKDPDNDKYRKIDKNNAPSLSSPGAEDMCLAMNFVKRNPTTLVLLRDRVDPALLYLGISALDATRQTPEYVDAKRELQFQKAVRAMFSQSDSSEAEAIARATFMAKAPAEPSDGRGALVQVKIADETVRRRFDGDDTLDCILNWLGGHASGIPSKVLSREWSLVDINHYPRAPIDCEENQNKTIQYIGCWPSGRLEIVPSTQAWHQDKKLDVKPGSSRGLGAASLK